MVFFFYRGANERCTYQWQIIARKPADDVISFVIERTLFQVHSCAFSRSILAFFIKEIFKQAEAYRIDVADRVAFYMGRSEYTQR